MSNVASQAAKLGRFESMIRNVMQKLSAPPEQTDLLLEAIRKRVGKAAVASGTAGAAAGGGVGYIAGRKAENKKNIREGNYLLGKKASKVEKVMREYKKGELRSGSKTGPKVKSRKQAIAIAMSESRDAGEKVPTKKASDFLTPEERLSLMHSGALLKCANEGMDKQAVLESVGSIFDAGTKAVIVASAVTGIPIGIMSHLMGKATRSNRMKEQELENKIKYYENAGQQMERNLTNQGVRI